jgi:hypothetical protein
MDMSAFNAIEAFASDTTRSMYDRAEALRIMGREGMGLDPVDNGEHLSDEDLVEEFLESVNA